MKNLDIPPLWTLLAILSALLLHRVVPVGLYALSGLWMAIVLVGVVMILWPVVWFKRTKTTLVPRQKPSTLIVEGPFKVTRNPMYLGMVLLTLGLGLFLGSVSALLPAFWLCWFLQKNFIIPEERKLREAKGQGVEDYFAATGRWIWFL